MPLMQLSHGSYHHQHATRTPAGVLAQASRHQHARHFCPRNKHVTAAVPGAGLAVEVDVAVIGAGIIGLLATRQLLLSSDASVALLDVKQPCAGATGAGELQGPSTHTPLSYIVTAELLGGAHVMGHVHTRLLGQEASM